jgi:hypothetical protein
MYSYANSTVKRGAIARPTLMPSWLAAFPKGAWQELGRAGFWGEVA